MKTIGIIGGMSWESSAQYYALINRDVRRRLGARHSAKILMHSLDFGEIEQLQHSGDWDALGVMMANSACALEAGGADCIVLATNTMHKLADRIEAASGLPFLHIADPAAAAIQRRGLTRVALLGTVFTMEQEFYRGRLADRHGLEVVLPGDRDRAEVHRVIYEELVAGEVLDSSRSAYRGIIERLVQSDAQGIILGCTEISLLVGQDDSAVPFFDTTALHARAAADFALG
ncbi:aspartate/glutamate racemase family protein [Sphingomonadaceae bacterium]|nr:aspartate/glutamate racemase family protein [Sphingomonadaceae bacterium]